MKKIPNANLGRDNPEAFRKKPKTPIVLVLDNVRSMNNVGSVFRTCDAFAVEALHLCGITACPPHRDIEKTALGATASVNWTHYPSTRESIEHLKAQGFQILAVEQLEGGQNLDVFRPSPSQKYALVFGNEVEGVSDEVIELCQVGLEIPQFGTKHSFNISVSVGIVLWDFYTKMNSATL